MWIIIIIIKKQKVKTEQSGVSFSYATETKTTYSRFVVNFFSFFPLS